VSNSQSAFIKGRCIHDNFILVQQTAKALHRPKETRILLKLDIFLEYAGDLRIFVLRREKG
jgi:hypothetical protein